VSGSFVAFEGGEGTGKSTQARRLAERRGALLTHEPGGTDIGVEIRRLLLSVETQGLDARAEALLMAADRAQHVEHLVGDVRDPADVGVARRGPLCYGCHLRGVPVARATRPRTWCP